MYMGGESGVTLFPPFPSSPSAPVVIPSIAVGVWASSTPSPSRKEVPFRSVPNAYHPLSLENDRCRHAGPS